MGDVIEMQAGLYQAKPFSAETPAGVFRMSGTLCGCIDFHVPGAGTYPLTPDETWAIAQALLNARQDVLDNSRPLSDPRIMP